VLAADASNPVQEKFSETDAPAKPEMIDEAQ
jgi:hypothetical protein